MENMEKRRRDKFHLIELVRKNPILWDSAQPHFKGAEAQKTEAWEVIGEAFNTSGTRIKRAFKSLRESYRRELVGKKQHGETYESKWMYFKSMDFLRRYIRERKNVAAKLNSTSDCNTTADLSSDFNDISNNGVTSTNHSFQLPEYLKNESIDLEDHDTPPGGGGGHNAGDDDDDDDDMMDDDYPFPEITLDTSSVALAKRRAKANEDGADYHADFLGNNGGRNSREMLHGKFCEYLAARLNSMPETEADDLMNNILKLFVN